MTHDEVKHALRTGGSVLAATDAQVRRAAEELDALNADVDDALDAAAAAADVDTPLDESSRHAPDRGGPRRWRDDGRPQSKVLVEDGQSPTSAPRTARWLRDEDPATAPFSDLQWKVMAALGLGAPPVPLPADVHARALGATLIEGRHGQALHRDLYEACTGAAPVAPLPDGVHQHVAEALGVAASVAVPRDLHARLAQALLG